MKKVIIQVTGSILIGGWLMSCQHNGDNKKTVVANSAPEVTSITQDLSNKTAGKDHPGRAVFVKYCLTCHQSDGSGVPGMHPPLTSGSWVGKDPKELITVLMKGLNGKVEVNGEVYKNFMPSQAQLSDQEMANVLSYIRSDFGNHFAPVDAEVVKKIRSGK